MTGLIREACAHPGRLHPIELAILDDLAAKSPSEWMPACFRMLVEIHRKACASKQ